MQPSLLIAWPVRVGVAAAGGKGGGAGELPFAGAQHDSAQPAKKHFYNPRQQGPIQQAQNRAGRLTIPGSTNPRQGPIQQAQNRAGRHMVDYKLAPPPPRQRVLTP